MEIIVELILELLLALAFEGAFEGVFRKIFGGKEDAEGSAEGGPKRRKELGPIPSAALYVSIGAFLGWVSLFLKPEHMLSDPMSSYINLALSPIFAGACMMALGSLRKKHGRRVLRMDKFFYGYLFALAFSLMRFLFAYDGLG